MLSKKRTNVIAVSFDPWKAFYKVWKEGLLKLLQIGVHGNVYIIMAKTHYFPQNYKDQSWRKKAKRSSENKRGWTTGCCYLIYYISGLYKCHCVQSTKTHLKHSPHIRPCCLVCRHQHSHCYLKNLNNYKTLSHMGRQVGSKNQWNKTGYIHYQHPGLTGSFQ